MRSTKFKSRSKTTNRDKELGDIKHKIFFKMYFYIISALSDLVGKVLIFTGRREYFARI